MQDQLPKNEGLWNSLHQPSVLPLRFSPDDSVPFHLLVLKVKAIKARSTLPGCQ